MLDLKKYFLHFCLRNKIFKLKVNIYLSILKFSLYLHPLIGLVVQLVRIPACHAGGREFESRPDRNKMLC